MARALGANIYWLGLDENEGGVHYPTHFRVSDGLETAAAMGWRVVRAHTLGISTGNALSFEPRLGVFNGSALDAADWAVAEAQRLGIKLFIPLTDNWRYYHGGKHDFTDWVGNPDETQFFSDAAAIAAFKTYIANRLNHVNAYTGRRTGDEPAIFCWETGNEFAAAPANWTQDIAAHIKALAPKHLVADGSNGVVDASLASPDVDIYSQHFYPASATGVVAAATRTSSSDKVFVNGEFGWNDGGVNIAAYLATVTATPAIAVSAFWSLFPHADTHGFVDHGDGFTVHVPGDDANMAAFNAAARASAAVMAGAPAPPLPMPPPPAITAITRARGYAATLAWRGAALATTYDVQVAAAAAGPWSDVCTACGSDFDTPIALPAKSAAVGAFLRCRGVNADGLAGGWSPPAAV